MRSGSGRDVGIDAGVPARGVRGRRTIREQRRSFRWEAGRGPAGSLLLEIVGNRCRPAKVARKKTRGDDLLSKTIPLALAVLLSNSRVSFCLARSGDDGDSSSGLLEFGKLVALLEEEFLTQDRDAAGGLDADSDPIALDFEDFDHDVLVDDDLFASLASEYQHEEPP
jgi:hypothetical protein